MPQHTGKPSGRQALPSMAMLPYARAWRIKRGKSLRQLAEEAGIDKNTLLQVEYERRQAAGATIGKLAKAMGIKPSTLLWTDPESVDDGRGTANTREAAPPVSGSARSYPKPVLTRAV